MTGQKDVLCMDVLEPKDHGEAVALFRSEIVGVLTRLDLPRGELAARLQLLSQQRFRPPGATATASGPLLCTQARTVWANTLIATGDRGLGP